MKMTKALGAGLFFIVALTNSCSEEKEGIEVSPYSWKESNLSPNGVFTFAWFEIGDDGLLYAYGISPIDGHAGFFKYLGPNWSANSTWTNIAEFDPGEFSNLQSFKIYHGSIYYNAFDKLYKIEGSETKEILSSDIITSFEVCQDKLVIIGNNINVSNDNFTIVSYDGTNFESLSKEMSLGRIIAANGKAYIPGFPSLAYDGQSLTPLTFYGSFFAVDKEEQLYFSDSFNERLILSRKSNFGEKETLGNFIEGMASIFRKLEFFDGTVFVVGVDVPRELSKVYFLRNDKWLQVPTEHVIYDVIVFNNRLIAFSMDGKIYELVKD